MLTDPNEQEDLNFGSATKKAFLKNKCSSSKKLCQDDYFGMKKR